MTDMRCPDCGVVMIEGGAGAVCSNPAKHATRPVMLTRVYEFCSAHHLIGMRNRHKCSRPHGHNYKVEITVTGPLLNGLIVDTADLDTCVRPVIARLDHRDLNEVAAEEGKGSLAEVLSQPSVENIVAYLWTSLGFLRPSATGSAGTNTPGFGLKRLRVYENDRTWAEVEE